YLHKDGKTYVRFSVTNRDNETQVFERPVIRHARIRDIGRPSQERPVIMLGLCVGKVYRFTQVNLADRSGFNFQLLVGRRFLAQRILVDPMREYTTEPTCPRPNHLGLGAAPKAGSKRKPKTTR
ncbi:MAG TPA: RimK/LysX family protein, partial [Gammaproteobacteria bacterium]|nr:RimK/LysX family protein [Gammaproteobacteria bacterium]